MSLTEASEHVSLCKSDGSGLSCIVSGEGIDNLNDVGYASGIK